MKVWIAKDWTGPHVFASPPKFSKFSETWQGHKLDCFDIRNSFTEDEIPRGQYIERDVWWSIVHIVK